MFHKMMLDGHGYRIPDTLWDDVRVQEWTMTCADEHHHHQQQQQTTTTRPPPAAAAPAAAAAAPAAAAERH